MITDTDLYKTAKNNKIPLVSVFMKDEPPKQIYLGVGYIINLQDASLNEGGTHFVALYIPLHQNKIIYMDSFGFPPSESTLNWIRVSPLRAFKMLYNENQIQNINTGGCGIYSLFFIDYMNKQNKFKPLEESLKSFQKLFSKDTKENLQRLKHYAPYYMDSKLSSTH